MKTGTVWAIIVECEEHMGQCQASLIEQLERLIPLANKAGLYDASDHLRDVINRQKRREYLDEIGRHKRQTEVDLVPVCFLMGDD